MTTADLPVRGASSHAFFRDMCFGSWRFRLREPCVIPVTSGQRCGEGFVQVESISLYRKTQALGVVDFMSRECLYYLRLVLVRYETAIQVVEDFDPGVRCVTERPTHARNDVVDLR
jgi:hypothetical protein